MREFFLKAGAVLMVLSAVAFGRKALLDNLWYAVAVLLYLAIGAGFWRAALRISPTQQ